MLRDRGIGFYLDEPTDPAMHDRTAPKEVFHHFIDAGLNLIVFRQPMQLVRLQRGRPERECGKQGAEADSKAEATH
jgi:hypothetical protein